MYIRVTVSVLPPKYTEEMVNKYKNMTDRREHPQTRTYRHTHRK